MPRDVTRMTYEGVFTRDDNPNQVREFNHVFSFDVMDTETGAMIMTNEYRTIATDEPLSLQVMEDRLTSMIETEQT